MPVKLTKLLVFLSCSLPLSACALGATASPFAAQEQGQPPTDDVPDIDKMIRDATAPLENAPQQSPTLPSSEPELDWQKKPAHASHVGQLLIYPFLACLVLTGIHCYLGIHVIARGVIFVDLALAQMAALGVALGIMLGRAFCSLDGLRSLTTQYLRLPAG